MGCSLDIDNGIEFLCADCGRRTLAYDFQETGEVPQGSLCPKCWMKKHPYDSKKAGSTKWPKRKRKK